MKSPGQLQYSLIAFRVRAIAVLVATTLWLLCLVLPPFAMEGPDTDNVGLNYFFIGWLGPLVGSFQWYANPALLYSSLSIRKCRFGHALVAALVGIALILTLMVRGEVSIGPNGSAKIEAYLSGYWFWLASGIILAGASLVRTPYARRDASNSAFGSDAVPRCAFHGAGQRSR